MLDNIRVLDLTDERGNLASTMLGVLGADVIAIEPPGGQHARSLGPFAGGVAGPDRSLVHWSANRGKRSVVLDIARSAADRDRFRALVAGADVLFETAKPGEWDAFGLGVDALSEINPALVHVSITPFGCTGPKAAWDAPDLVALAAGAQLLLCGDPDRAPLRCSVPQAWVHTSGDAADAALIALWERYRSGRGQHIDISAQASVMQATQSLVLNHAFGAKLAFRVGGGMRLGPLDIQLVYPCQDGTVSITFTFGASVGPFSQRLFEWIYEEGGCDEATRDKDWVMFATQVHTGEETIEEFNRLKAVLSAFCMTKTKQELLDGAMKRKLVIAPVSTIADVLDAEHFRYRKYWDTIEHGELGRTLRFPGPFVQPSYGRLAAMGPAPKLGEHTAEVLAETARPGADTLRAAAPANAAAPTDKPLTGVKILDFMWSLAGPSITRVLADCGATIVRIESSHRVEMGRTLSPFWNDEPNPETSAVFLNANAGKLGVCLDLNTEAGRAVVADLVRWADVVTEAYSPGAMKRWGLDYEHLRQINPSIVMMSSSLLGQTGPLAAFAGYGNLAAAFAGFYNLTGWPDRLCVGPYGGYTDYLSPRFGVAAVMAALHRRASTGEGCYLDFSQTEAAMWALGPAFADFEANDNLWGPVGNDDLNHAPHVVAPAAGNDRWVAIVCETDQQWQSLCRLAGFDAKLVALTTRARLDRRAELDELVRRWTADQPAAELAQRLQAAGVPAHPLLDGREILQDPQLAHRRHFVTVDHSVIGSLPLEGSRFRFSRTPASPINPPPTMAQHNYDVLSGMLGYDDERIAGLIADAILE